MIKTRYGTGNTLITPTVGIAGGAQEPYFIASHTSEAVQINLTNAAEVTFTPRAATVGAVRGPRPVGTPGRLQRGLAFTACS